MSAKILGAYLAIAMSAASTPAMRLVPGGHYLPFIGAKKISIPVKAFWLDEHAVTNAEFRDFVAAYPEWSRRQVKRVFADERYLEHWTSRDEPATDQEEAPVTRVSWFAARAFCMASGKRLPTTTEWEFAAIGEKDRDATRKQILAWYAKPTNSRLPNAAAASPNALGLRGLHGLVWEWTEDFAAAAAGVKGDQRFYCGASDSDIADPSDYATYMRFSFRDSLEATYSQPNLGFRCASSDLKTVAAPKTSPTSRQLSTSIYQLRSVWTTRSGKPMSLADLRGSRVFMAMFYARCQTTCPLTVQRFRHLFRSLSPEERKHTHFVLVSLDPRHDDPAKLRHFAKMHHLPDDRWILLTGDDDNVRELAAALDFKYRDEGDQQIVHSSRIIELDGDGVPVRDVTLEDERIPSDPSANAL